MSNKRHIALCETHPDVMMDDCHIDLIHSLILASKPSYVLEIGIGTGAVTKTILEAIKTNEVGELTCVDNFGDWNFQEPPGFREIAHLTHFIQSSEEAFVRTCKKQYDFIISDADHAHTGEWCEDTFRLVAPKGILIYHDATSFHCPSVQEAVSKAKEWGFQCLIFNKSSHEWEQCGRGLAILQKP